MVISHGERNSYGYCMKTVLSVSKIAGTGYKAAAVFAHELQHQYQFVFGNAQRFAHAFSLKESVLEERIGEAAAETAAISICTTSGTTIRKRGRRTGTR